MVKEKPNGKLADIWCATCGERTYHTPEMKWTLKDESRGIGICSECAAVLDEKDLVLPDKSEDGYATFD